MLWLVSCCDYLLLKTTDTILDLQIMKMFSGEHAP